MATIKSKKETSKQTKTMAHDHDLLESLYTLLSSGANTSPRVHVATSSSNFAASCLDCSETVNLDDTARISEHPDNLNFNQDLPDPSACFTIFQFESEPERLIQLPHPAPPPRLHYATWWRCIGRKIYSRHIQSIKDGSRRRMDE